MVIFRAMRNFGSIRRLWSGFQMGAATLVCPVFFGRGMGADSSKLTISRRALHRHSKFTAFRRSRAAFITR